MSEGDELIKRLATDLTVRFGRGFGWRNLYQMRAFHLAYQQILQTASAKLRRPFKAGMSHLAFLGLKDEYSEHDLEEALIHKLEDFPRQA